MFGNRHKEVMDILDFEFTYKDIKIICKHGDITSIQVDAIGEDLLNLIVL
jgi:hypothetical protein